MKKLMMVAVMAVSAVAFAQGRGPRGGHEGPRGPHEGHRGGMHQRGEMGPQRGPMQGGRMGGEGAAMDPVVMMIMNPKVAEAIGLTDEQKTKLEALKPERGEARQANEKVRQGMKKQIELLNAETIDEAAVMAAIDEVFEARKEIAKAQTKRLIDMKSVLTPEQIKKAREIAREHAPRGPRGPQGGRRGGMGPKGPAPEAPEAPEAPAAE